MRPITCVAFAMALCAFPVLVEAQAPAPPAETGPAEAAPATPPQAPTAPAAPSYPPPPPRWADQPPVEYPFPQATAGQPAGSFPYGPPPVPPPDGVNRRFSATAAIGPGALIGPGESELAVSYQVIRAGLGLDRDLILLFSYQGAGTSSISPMTREESWLKQEIVAGGLQHFVSQRVYLRGGLGVGFVSEESNSQTLSGGKGIAALAGVGYELMQKRHLSVGLDLHASLTHYPVESWKTVGLDVTVSVF